MRSTQHGSRPGTEKRTSRPVRPTAEEVPDQQKGRLFWPELRFARQANIHAPDRDLWRDYIDAYGQVNYTKGRSKALGSIACTFVSATEFNKILPPGSMSRRSAIELQQSIASRFNAMVSQNEKSKLDVADEASTVISESRLEALRQAQMADPEAIFLDLEDDLFESAERLYSNVAWSLGHLSVGSFGKYGFKKLGFDLSDNEALFEERAAVIDFLQRQDLDTSLLERTEWKPHITTFISFAEAGSIVLQTDKKVRAPRDILLNPPKALVNTNQPGTSAY